MNTPLLIFFLCSTPQTVSSFVNPSSTRHKLTEEEINNEARRQDMIKALKTCSPENCPELDLSFSSVYSDQDLASEGLSQIDIRGAVPNPSEFYHIWNLEFYKAAWEDTQRVAMAPANWDLQDWAIVGAIAGGTGLLLLVDDDVRSWAEGIHSSSLDTLADIGNAFGDGKIMLPAYGVTYLAGEITHDVRLRRVSMLALESFLLSGAITQIGKLSTQRERPDEAQDQYDFWVNGFNIDHDSFPSGHCTVAFSTATVVSMEYGSDYPWITFLAYGLASTTAFARIYDDHHWASDVFMGAAIGTAVGWAISEFHRERGRQAQQVIITPYYDGQFYGVRVGIEF